MADKGVTQGQLALALGIPQQSVSQRLLGRAPITVEELSVIAAKLEVPAATLLPPDK